MFDWKTLLLLATLLATGIGPARADEAQDFLASVKAQTVATKTAIEAARKKAVEDGAKAKKVDAETRGSCQELITVAGELEKAEIEAKKQAKALQEAQAEANKLAAAAQVQKVLIREGYLDGSVRARPALRLAPEAPPPESVYANESPDVTRARVVQVCTAIVAKPVTASIEAPPPPSAAPPVALPKGKKK